MTDTTGPDAATTNHDDGGTSTDTTLAATSTATLGMVRTWTKTGAQLLDADRAHREGHCYATGQDAIAAAIAALNWVELIPHGGVSMPLSPGGAIKALIYGLGLRDVRRVAWDGSLPVRDDVEGAHSRYSVLGIEFVADGCLLRLFAVDRGTDVLTVAHDRIPDAPVSDPAAERASRALTAWVRGRSQ